MSAQKSAAYALIIFLMIAGVAFMLYQNKRLTASRPVQPVNLNQPAGSKLAPATPALAPLDSALGTGAISNQTAAESNQILDMNKNDQAGDFDLTIFSTDKFKNLRANMFIIKEPTEVGKRNPFKPN